ncbi:MBL fold metallo-hydrolase [Alicyclobacillaceae bacterium I2511]|jgi:glyoxylase-like metal-dependent hydrolase (beta-lactamase superfamily II)|nr:MBL fold metallo-hydrolase [Alicyclobacillaceae bacterium I2511]
MIQYRANGVTVFQSVLYQTTSTVVETPSCVFIVDPGWLPQEVEEIRAFVARIRRGRPLYLLFTHSDWDHILGYKAFPDAITVASFEFVNNSDKQVCVEQILDFDKQYYLKRDYEIVYPLIDVIIYHEKQKIEIGETRVTFYKAPGHTACGLFGIIEPQGVFIAGDYLSEVEFPFIEDSSDSYVQTLHKVSDILENYSIKLLVPGHGQSTTQVREMQLRKQLSLDYIQTLRAYVQNGNQEEITRMLDPYEFASGMRRYHENNEIIIKREFSDI